MIQILATLQENGTYTFTGLSSFVNLIGIIISTWLTLD